MNHARERNSFVVLNLPRRKLEAWMSRTLSTLLGCLLPLLLVLLIALFGLGEGVKLFVVLIHMFVCQLLVIGSHLQGGYRNEICPADEGAHHANP